MRYLIIIENMANDLTFNGYDLNIFIIVFTLLVISIYVFINYFGYWLNPFHKHKISQTMEEYYEHLKEKHPDIWEEYKLTDEGIKEFIRKVRNKEDES